MKYYVKRKDTGIILNDNHFLSGIGQNAKIN
jgi:hypothetical protein